MLPKRFRILLAGVSFLCGCATRGPVLDYCINDVKAHVLACINKDGKEYYLTWDEAKRFVCHSPDDLALLLNYCGLKGDK
jgi:hypothetical protein